MSTISWEDIGIHPNVGTLLEEEGIEVTDVDDFTEWDQLRAAASNNISVEQEKEQLRRIVIEGRNNNTAKSTAQGVRNLEKFLRGKGETRNLEEIDPDDLDNHIGRWMLHMKNELYEPGTLTSYHRGVERYLKDKGYKHSLITSDAFKTSRDLLTTSKTKLKEQGKGQHPNAGDPLDDEHIEQLWTTGQLGEANPTALQNTIWYYFALCFGLRPSSETRNMKFGDVQHEGTYLSFSERVTKTRDGSTEGPGSSRKFRPRLYATPDQPERCPIAFYDKFIMHRPPSMSLPSSPFFLAINDKRKPTSYWYKAGPLGEGSIRGIVKEMCARAGITGGNFINYSIRKRVAQALLNAGVPPHIIAQLTGHKNPATLNQYSIAPVAMQRGMSHILTHTNRPTGLQSALEYSNGTTATPAFLAPPSVRGHGRLHAATSSANATLPQLSLPWAVMNNGVAQGACMTETASLPPQSHELKTMETVLDPTSGPVLGASQESHGTGSRPMTLGVVGETTIPSAGLHVASQSTLSSRGIMSGATFNVAANAVFNMHIHVHEVAK